MKFYLTSRTIPELQDLPLSERLSAIDRATKKLTPPEKLVLNIIKLLIIVPVFALILRVGEDWKALLWAACFIALYPTLLKPVQLNMIRKYLRKKGS